MILLWWNITSLNLYDSVVIFKGCLPGEGHGHFESNIMLVGWRGFQGNLLIYTDNQIATKTLKNVFSIFLLVHESWVFLKKNIKSYKGTGVLGYIEISLDELARTAMNLRIFEMSHDIGILLHMYNQSSDYTHSNQSF